MQHVPKGFNEEQNCNRANVGAAKCDDIKCELAILLAQPSTRLFAACGARLQLEDDACGEAKIILHVRGAVGELGPQPIRLEGPYGNVGR